MSSTHIEDVVTILPQARLDTTSRTPSIVISLSTDLARSVEIKGQATHEEFLGSLGTGKFKTLLQSSLSTEDLPFIQTIECNNGFIGACMAPQPCDPSR